MERVMFLVERTGDRISCLLNPESLEVRRVAGLQRRTGAGGATLGALRGDDPVVTVGGGTTEYDLNLLFDVDIAMEGRSVVATASASPAQSRMDVRSLTQPLWALAETASDAAGMALPQRVRFIWGKSWNVPSVVVAAAERLDRFDANGVPQRSWLSLRLRRVDEDSVSSGPSPAPITPQFELGTSPSTLPEGDHDVVPLIIDDAGTPQNRLDLIADAHGGDPALHRVFAEWSGIDDMLRVPVGTVVRVPGQSQFRHLA